MEWMLLGTIAAAMVWYFGWTWWIIRMKLEGGCRSMQGISQERGKVVAEARGSLLLICGGGADACGAEEAADLEERLTAAVRNRLAEEPGLTVNYVDRGGPGFGFRTAFEHDGRVRIRGGAPAGYEVAVRDGGEAGVVAVRRVGTGMFNYRHSWNVMGPGRRHVFGRWLQDFA